jgi:hypothetical protein
MAEEYVLVKKTTYDRMKQSERVETHDLGVNTEDPPSREVTETPLDRHAEMWQNPPDGHSETW